MKIEARTRRLEVGVYNTPKNMEAPINKVRIAKVITNEASETGNRSINLDFNIETDSETEEELRDQTLPSIIKNEKENIK